MTVLSQVFKEVTPALAALGYKKTGNTYRLTADNNDQALINFQLSDASGEDVIFYVNVAIVPQTQSEVLNFILQRSKALPSYEEGIFTDRVWPPEDFQYDNHSRFRDQRWQISEGNANRCGTTLAETLTRDVCPLLLRLLNRRELLGYLNVPKDEKPFRADPSTRSTVVLLIDEGGPDLEAALSEYKQAEGRNRFVEWAEQRLQLASPGSGSDAI